MTPSLRAKLVGSVACALGLLAVALPFNLTAHAEAPQNEGNYTKLDLTGKGSVQAAPDQITASFSAESRSNSAAAAQQAVNTLVHKATEQAKQAEGVKYAVLHYSVSELNDEKGKHNAWSASQNLTFTAPDGQSLLPLTGQLQASGLLLQGLDWSLSADKEKALQLEAEKAAVVDLKKQADTLAAALGLHVVRFTHVSISGQPFPRPIFMAAMAARSMDSAPAPSSTAETQTVSASVSGTALLAP